MTYNKVVWHEQQNKIKLSFFDLREKFVNAHFYERKKPVTFVHGGCTADGTPLCSGMSYLQERSGAHKLAGKTLSKQENENVSKWMLCTPKSIRAGAVKDYIDARKAAFSNLKRGNIKKFKMQYRKHGDRKYPSIRIEKTCISVSDDGKYVYICPRTMKKTIVSKTAKNATDKILVGKSERQFLIEQHSNLKDCRLKMENGDWYLFVPYEKSVENQVKNEKPDMTCAIDPGVRSVYTLYDAENMIKFEHNIELQFRLQRRLDKFRSLRDTKKISQYSYTRRRWRINKKWKGLVDDMHYKIASTLVKNYKFIGLPPFETSNMVKGNRLSKKTKREMLGIRHYQLKQRVYSAARGHSTVYQVDESYTTQSCTRCGTLNYVGGSKLYKCKSCNVAVDRDSGSARSIFMCLLQRRFT
jgi:transposase